MTIAAKGLVCIATNVHSCLQTCDQALFIDQVYIMYTYVKILVPLLLRVQDVHK